jgi:hypothetical protein
MKGLRTRRPGSQRAPSAAAPAAVREGTRSSGQPLDPGTLAHMESGFGHDFSRVRIHADEAGARSARALGASAYTVGEDVVFGAGAYDPHGAAGRERIAHELAHVVQQSGAGAPARTLSARSDASERAAGDAAARVAAGGTAAVAAGTAEALVAREEWSLSPDGEPAPTTNVLQEFDVDKAKGGKPWNLDKLTKQIGEALKGHKDRYIEVVAYHGADLEDSRDAAKKRAATVMKALLQWIPTLKGRLRTSLRDRGLLTGPLTPRQVGVEWGPFGSFAPGTFDSPLLKPGFIMPDEGPLVPKATPLPEGAPASPEAEPFSPRPGASGAYPAAQMDVLKVFFASPPGQRLKAFLKKNGKQLWKDFINLPGGEIAAIVISQLIPPAIVLSFVAAMTEQQRKAFFDRLGKDFGGINPDLDVHAIRPMEEKTWNIALDVDADLGPRQLRTPIGDFDVGKKPSRPGVTAMGIDLRINKAATKTFYKAGENISVGYAVPDEGWTIEMVSDDAKTKAVVETRKVHPTKDGSETFLAPSEAGIYTLRLVDGLGGEAKRTVRFKVQ